VRTLFLELMTLATSYCFPPSSPSKTHSRLSPAFHHVMMQFAYPSPSTSDLLTFFAYLWLLNLSRQFFQRVLGAGLLGDVAIGIIFGSPLAGWLDEGWQSTLVVLGYLGLLLIVLEGD